MELAGKTFVVTGANTGIGRATVQALADRGARRIVIAARSRDKTQPVIEELGARARDTEVRFVALDLGELASVRRAADELLQKDWTIDALINNAGIGGVPGLTRDGFELAFGTNHLGHFLFTEKLLPLVTRAPAGRIVNVSSNAHYRAKGIDWDALRRPSATVSAMPEYAVSKLCNVLHAKELARRLAGTKVTTYAVHPGVVASDIWSRRLGIFAKLVTWTMLTNEDGARTQLRCATDPTLAGETGLFYAKEKAKAPNPVADDVALQDELRRRSEAWVAPFLATA